MDIDLNYVGALDLAAMERERPEVDAAIERLFASHGHSVRRRPTGHAGGKWLARYASVLGGNSPLDLDLNDTVHQPLFGAVRMASRTVCPRRAAAREQQESETMRGFLERSLSITRVPSRAKIRLHSSHMFVRRNDSP